MDRGTAYCTQPSISSCRMRAACAASASGASTISSSCTVRIRRALQALGPQPPPYPYHCQFDHIGSGALDGGVPGHPLAAGTNVEVGAGQLRQSTPPPKQGGYIAIGLGIGNGLVHIIAYLGEGCQIALEEIIGFLDRDPDVLGQAVCPLAVHDAEIDGLGRGTQPGVTSAGSRP